MRVWVPNCHRRPKIGIVTLYPAIYSCRVSLIFNVDIHSKLLALPRMSGMVSGAHFLPILRHRLSGLVREAHGTMGSPDSSPGLGKHHIFRRCLAKFQGHRRPSSSHVWNDGFAYGVLHPKRRYHGTPAPFFWDANWPFLREQKSWTRRWNGVLFTIPNLVVCIAALDNMFVVNVVNGDPVPFWHFDRGFFFFAFSSRLWHVVAMKYCGCTMDGMRHQLIDGWFIPL